MTTWIELPARAAAALAHGFVALALIVCAGLQGCAAPRERIELERWSAAWCEPCQRMDRDSWSDPGVAAWLAEHASVSARDLERDADLAQRLGVRAIPCVIARRAGVELGRLAGFQDPAPLRGWLETMARGGRDVDAALAASESEPGDADAQQRLARALREDGWHAEAARVLVGLWDLPRGRRGSLEPRIADETRLAAETDDLARTILRVPRASQFERARTDDAALADWIELSLATGDGGEIAHWFLERPAEPRRTEVLVAARPALWRALRAAGEHAAIVELVELSTSAVTWARNRAAISEFERRSFDAPTIAMLRAERRDDVLDLARGLILLGRDAEAAELSAILRESGLR